MGVIRNKVHRITLPEEEWLQGWPGCLVSPLLAEEVSRIVSTADVMELGDTGSNAFPDLVEGQGIVALVETRVWHGGAVDDGLVVSKHHRTSLDMDSKIAEFNAKIDDLFHVPWQCVRRRIRRRRLRFPQWTASWSTSQ